MDIRRALAALLVAPLLVAPLLALTACDSATSTADPPARVLPSPSPSSTPPRPETVELFIRRWADENKRMQNTGDIEPFLALCRSCQGCKAIARRIAEIYRHQGAVRTKGWTIRSIRSDDKGKERVVDLRVDAAPTFYREGRDSPIQHLPGGPEHYQLHVSRTAESWVVISLIAFGS